MSLITINQIIKLPKVELHCHLDGSLRVESIIDQAKLDKLGLPFDDNESLSNYFKFKKKSNLEQYLKKFELTLIVMQTPESLIRYSYELIEDVNKENVIYIEVRFSPILHLKNGMNLEIALESVIKGLKKGEKDFGVKSGIIICGIRHISPEASLKLAELAVKYKDCGVVGFDLAGIEENFPAKEHRKAFYLIRNNNLNATIHAGEAYGPSSIHQAIHQCGANRIGHGTRLIENQDLMHYVNDHRIALEICLTSNWQTSSIKSLSSHPLKFYYENGLRVTLNTDNRLISNTSLAREFMLAHTNFGFDLDDFKKITIYSIKSAFMNYDNRLQMIKEIINKFEKNSLKNFSTKT